MSQHSTINGFLFMVPVACGRPGCGQIDRSNVCMGCGDVGYCSEDCRRQHWIGRHKEYCTKIEQLERLQERAIEARDPDAIERVLVALVQALRVYFSKKLHSLDGLPVNFAQFRDRFTAIVSKVGLSSRKLEEEHHHILLEILDEAERLREEGKLVWYEQNRTTSIKNEVKHLRVCQLVKQAEFFNLGGDLEACSLLFDSALSLTREIEIEELDGDKLSRVVFYCARARVYRRNGKLDEEINAYEKAYEVMQETCSPDEISLQEITKNLVNLYRRAGDHEKADYFAEVVVENLKNNYEGQYRAEIGLAVRDLAEGIILQATKEENKNRKAVLLDKYEDLLREALCHFDCHEGPRAARIQGMRGITAESARVHKHITRKLLLDFIVTYSRYDTAVDSQDLINTHIEESWEYNKKRDLVNCDYDDLLFAYRVSGSYFNYRKEFGPPLNRVESELLMRRISEVQAIADRETAAQRSLDANNQK